MTEQETIEWMMNSYTIAELSHDTGLSKSTLYRMFSGIATQRTWEKLKPIIDALAHDEAEEADPFRTEGR